MTFNPVSSFMVSAAALFVIGSIEPAGAYVHREFRDWSVTCSNGLTCSIEHALEGDDRFYSVALERRGAPEAPVNLLLGMRGEDVAGDMRVTFELDDGSAFEWRASEDPETLGGIRLELTESEDMQALIEAMASGTDLTLGIEGDGEPFTHKTSLSGVTAALLFVDEAQERVGRRDALQAKGEVAPPAEASVRPLEDMAQLPERVRVDFKDDMAECGGLEPDRFALLEGFVVDRGDEGVLVGLPCGMGGAYNQPYVLYSGADMDTLHREGFPNMGEVGPVSSVFAYNLAYEPETKTLSSFFRGRGIGDCGSYAEWSMQQTGIGIGLVLTSQRSKGDCDGDYAGGPENWPSEWPR